MVPGSTPGWTANFSEYNVARRQANTASRIDDVPVLREIGSLHLAYEWSVRLPEELEELVRFQTDAPSCLLKRCILVVQASLTGVQGNVQSGEKPVQIRGRMF